MIDKDGKIWCSFIDWDMYESMKALEDQEFQEFLHSILKLQKTRLPQKIIITTPRRPLGYFTEEMTEETIGYSTEEFISYPDWETFWEEFKNAQNERDGEKRERNKEETNKGDRY